MKQMKNTMLTYNHYKQKKKLRSNCFISMCLLIKIKKLIFEFINFKFLVLWEKEICKLKEGKFVEVHTVSYAQETRKKQLLNQLPILNKKTEKTLKVFSVFLCFNPINNFRSIG